LISQHVVPGGALAAGYLPVRASSVAGGVDGVFGALFWISLFFLVLIVGLTILFVVRYRVRPGRTEADRTASHDTRLELLWSVVPLVILMGLFVASTRTWLHMVRGDGAGGQRLEVRVTARKWSWWFDHPGGRGAGELHLVAGRPTELVLASTDVIHSLFVPEFRLKQDAVPGRFTRMTFTPTLAGEYTILCAEYCGTDHSRMQAKVVVHPDQRSFDAWAQEGQAQLASLGDRGKAVFAQRGCAGCHSVDGTRRVGPSLKGLWNRKEKLADGSEVLVDDEYLRESLVKPAAKLVAGFPNVMPPVVLDERDLAALAAYLKTLSEAP
jgi:cytochrome c oxidase subunit 2